MQLFLSSKTRNILVIGICITVVVLILVLLFYCRGSNKFDKLYSGKYTNFEITGSPSQKPTSIPTTIPEYDYTAKSIKNLNISNAHAGNIAYIRDGNVWVWRDGSDYQITKDGIPRTDSIRTANSVNYQNPVLSPDRQKILFTQERIGRVDGSENSSYRVWWNTVDNPSDPKSLSNDVKCIYGELDWGPNSDRVYCISYTSDTSSEDAFVAVMSLTDKEVQRLGNFKVGGGCGGGAGNPSGELEWAENLSQYVSTFSFTPDGKYILHSNSCTGNGIEALELKTGTNTTLDPSAGSAVFSPSGKLLATISSNAEKLASDRENWQLYQHKVINVYRVEDWKLVHTFEKDEEILSIAYGTDENTLYYVTKSDNGPHLSLVVTGYYGGEKFQTPIYKVSLSRLDVINNEWQEISKLNAYSGKILGVDSQGILLSVIENPIEIFKYLVEHRIYDEGAKSYLPKVRVITVNEKETGENIKLLIDDANHARSR